MLLIPHPVYSSLIGIKSCPEIDVLSTCQPVFRTLQRLSHLNSQFLSRALAAISMKGSIPIAKSLFSFLMERHIAPTPASVGLYVQLLHNHHLPSDVLSVYRAMLSAGINLAIFSPAAGASASDPSRIQSIVGLAHHHRALRHAQLSDAVDMNTTDSSIIADPFLGSTPPPSSSAFSSSSSSSASSPASSSTSSSSVTTATSHDPLEGDYGTLGHVQTAPLTGLASESYLYRKDLPLQVRSYILTSITNMEGSDVDWPSLTAALPLASDGSLLPDKPSRDALHGRQSAVSSHSTMLNKGISWNTYMLDKELTQLFHSRLNHPLEVAREGLTVRAYTAVAGAALIRARKMRSLTKAVVTKDSVANLSTSANKPMTVTSSHANTSSLSSTEASYLMYVALRCLAEVLAEAVHLQGLQMRMINTVLRACVEFQLHRLGHAIYTLICPETPLYSATSRPFSFSSPDTSVDNTSTSSVVETRHQYGIAKELLTAGRVTRRQYLLYPDSRTVSFASAMYLQSTDAINIEHGIRLACTLAIQGHILPRFLIEMLHTTSARLEAALNRQGIRGIAKKSSAGDTDRYDPDNIIDHQALSTRETNDGETTSSPSRLQNVAEVSPALKNWLSSLKKILSPEHKTTTIDATCIPLDLLAFNFLPPSSIPIHRQYYRPSMSPPPHPSRPLFIPSDKITGKQVGERPR